jgi:tetratricopeptide (TPR) repeat protein
MTHVVFRSLVNTGLLLLAMGSSHVQAQADRLPSEPNFFTWGELALLPEYCRDTQGVLYQVHGNGQDSPRAPYWLSLMGTDFWHMHHYCYALAYVMRSEQPGLNPTQKKYLYLKAISDYNYVIKNALSTMALMPEVHYKVGELQLLMDNPGAASEQFARSRKLKPDYWPAYARWADVLAGVKRYDDALALVREGLRQVPDNKELLKRAAKYEAAGGRAAPLGKVAAANPAPVVSVPPAATTAPDSTPSSAPPGAAEAPK